MKAHLIPLLVVLAAASARAQSSAAQAESLFRDGRALMDQGKLAEACTAFEGSQKLEPAVATLLNLGKCRELNKQLAAAWGAFLEAEREARDASDASAQKLHDVARRHAKDLEPRVSRLTIHVPADHRIDGLEIQRGDVPVDASAWNRALPVDGGTYTIVARAAGAEPWTTTVTIGVEGDRKTVDVPKLAPATAAAAAAQPSSTPRATPRPSRLVPLVVGAVAVAALGGGLGFELWGDSTYDRSKTEADPTQQDALWHSANDKRYIAEGLAVGGIACASVAVWLWLRNPRDDHASDHLAIAPTANGFALTGSF